jgi:predicted aspartyl protease
MSLVRLSFAPDELQDDGPFIKISISNPSLEREEGRVVGFEFPNPLEINALIDTGASVTIINPQVAATCRFRQTGFAHIVAADNEGKYPEHAAAIRFPGTDLKGVDPIRVVAVRLVRRPFSCLIGRDILRKWLVTYDGLSGQVVIRD